MNDHPHMRRRRFGRVLTVAAAGLAGLLLLAALLLATPPGLALVAGLAGTLASDSERQVCISGLSGLLSGDLRLNEVSVADREGAWLTVSDIAIRWHPWALLSGTVRIDSLEVARIAVERQPEADESSAPAESGGGLPAMRLSLDRLTIGEIALAKPVLGEAVTVSVDGSAELHDDPARARLALALERLDGTAGSLRLRAAFAPDSDELELDMEGAEPAGGAIARLLGLPGLPAVAVSLKGAGSLERWAGDLRLQLDGEDAVSGTASVTALDGNRQGHRIQATIDGRLALFAPATLLPLLAGDSIIGLDAVHAGDVTLIDRLTVRSATAMVEASGTYDGAARSTDLLLDARIGEADTELRFALDDMPVTLGHTTLQARLSGPLHAVRWRATGAMARLALPQADIGAVTLQAGGDDADLDAMSVPFNAILSAETITLDEPQAAGFVYGATRLEAAGRWSDGVLTLDQADARTGAGEIALAGRVAGDLDTLSLALSGTLRETRDETVARLLAGAPLEFSARLERAGDRLSLNDASVSAAGVQARAQATLAGDDITASGRIDALNLAPLDERLGGSLDAAFEVGGTLTAPSLRASAKGSDVTLLGKPFADAALELDGQLIDATPSGRLLLTGMLDGKPVRADARLAAHEDGSSSADDISVRVGDAAITGALTLPADGVPHGALDIDIPQLADIAPLLLMDDLSGALTGRVTLTDEAGRLALRVTADSPALAIATTRIDRLKVEAAISDALGAATLNGLVAAERIHAGAMVLSGLRLTGEGADGASVFALDAQLDGHPAHLSGSLAAQGDAMEVTLDKAQARIMGIDARLGSPARIAVAGGTASFDTVTLAIGNGELAVSGSAGERLDVKARLSAFPLAAINPLTGGAGLGGTVSGDIAVTGSAGDPAVDFTAEWRDATAAALRDAGIAALNVAAKGRYHADMVDLTADVSGQGMALTAAGRVHLDGPRLDLTAKGTVPFAVAREALARSGARLDGEARVDLTIKGSASNPDIAGTITTAGATFVETGSGIAMRNIEGTVRLAGGQARIESITGAVGSKGKVQVTGAVDIAPGSDFNADLAITLNEVQYSDGALVTALVDAQLTVKGPLMVTPTLGGRIAIDRADITVPTQFSGSIAAVDVEHVGASQAVSAQAEALRPPSSAGGGNAALALDLEVAAPRRIYVRGRGMDAELGGNIKLTGSAATPQAVGSFDMIRGRMDVLTKQLSFSRGHVTMTGSLDPTLNFAAQHSSGGVTTIIEITGRASDPRITFSSIPALPQDEVMARFLFDSDLAGLSPVQLAQLASAIATLTGVTGGPGVLDRIRDMLGVDNLEISANPDGSGASVTAGRYLTDRAYVGVKQGTDLSSSSVTTNIDLTDTIKLKGEVDARGRTKGGIFMERDY